MPLFVRDRRTVELTAVGQALVAPASDALSALQRVTVMASSAGKGEIGRVRIAYAGSSSQTMTD